MGLEEYKAARRSLSPQAVEIHLELKHIKGEVGVILIEGSHIRGGGP